MNPIRLIVAACLFTALACDNKSSNQETRAAVAAEPSRAAPKARVAPVDLCALVTETEAESVLGMSLEPPQKQRGGDCWYLREGGTDFGAVELIISLIYPPTPVRSEADFDRFIADQVKQTNESLKKRGVGMMAFTAEPAKGVGAPAYFIDPGLYVLKGDRILALALGGEKGVAMARIAVSRLP